VSLGSGFQVLVSAVGLYLVSFYVATTLHSICTFYYVGACIVASVFVVVG
jgi:hypothetical protein